MGTAFRFRSATWRIIRESLERFGQVEPLVVRKSSGLVVGGNGRLRAMREMGWTDAQIVEVEITDEQAIALGIALNRSAELAEWDAARLVQSLAAIANTGDDEDGLTTSLAGIGFDVAELEDLIKVSEHERRPPGSLESPEDFREFGEDIETEHQCPKCRYEWSGSLT